MLVFWVGLYTVLWGSTEVGGNCVRKDGGQYTFEWLCADNGVITLAQSDNIKNCYTCFLKKFSDWMIEKSKTDKDDVSAAANDYLKTLGFVSIAYAWIKVLEVSFKDYND